MSNQESAPVFLNAGDDPEMAAANRQARQTFRYFWRELSWERRRIIPGLDLACVKVAFSDPPEVFDRSDEDSPGVEEMWVSDVDFDGQRVSGTLINQPNWLKSVKEGDAVSVPPKEVNDWMYAISGKVYGAYTVNLLRSRMSRSERAQHDAAWGLDFGDPNSIHVVPPEFFGKKKPGLLGKFFGGGNKAPDMAEVEAAEHPMAANMGPSLEETLKEKPHFVHEADDRGFTLLHSLALAGTAIGVEIMLRHGADPNAVTKNGMTPLRLAKSLGWKKVAETLQRAGGK